MGIVKYKSHIMTEIKYKEVKQAELHDQGLMAKLNLFFFGEEIIHKADWLWFYGTIIIMIGISVVTFLITL